MSKVNVLFVALMIGLSSTSFARKQKLPEPLPGQVATGDAVLVQAVQNQKGISFLTAKGLIVTQLLKEDSSGLPHQKFNVKLSNGRVIMIVSNLDMCENIPIQVGDEVSVGGQFIATGKASGLVHWTHKDPRKKRPDGFIEFKGHVYCQ